MEDTRKKVWLLVRAAVVVSGVLGGKSFVPGVHAVFGGTSLTLLSVFFGFGIVAVMLVIGLQVLNPRSARIWTEPDWYTNPFLLSQPLQFSYLCGAYLIAAGVGAIALAQLKDLAGLEPYLPLVMGIGVLVGIRLCSRLYSRKFASNMRAPVGQP